MTPERWGEVKKVFQGVLVLEPEERGKFLEHACSGDSLLRAEVESLLTSLARHPGIDSAVMPGGAAKLADALAEERLEHSQDDAWLPPAPGPDDPGATGEGPPGGAIMVADRYALLGELGKGGMGVVYRAHDAILARDVALKVLRECAFFTGSPSEAARRFQQEARNLARLQHPNIVSVYDSGLDRGFPFLVMELLDGTDLATLMSNGSHLALDQRLRIVLDVCRGLHHAHEQGIIHRDVKPRNIQVVSTPPRAHDGQANRGSLTAKLTDFGVAKLVGDDPGITTTGRIVGTPAYMSPEQVQGHHVDRRADIFAAGIVLHELVSGRHPFEAPSSGAMMFNIVSKPLSPLDQACWSEAPAVPDIVAHALEKDPASGTNPPAKWPVTSSARSKGSLFMCRCARRGPMARRRGASVFCSCPRREGGFSDWCRWARCWR